MRECLRVLDEPDLDAAGHFHLGANDLRRDVASFIGIGSNPSHSMNIRTTETALPMFGCMWSNVTDFIGTTAHAGAKSFGKAIQRLLREPERFQPFVCESNIDCEPRPVLFLSGIDAVEHVAQPRACFPALGEL